MSDRLYVCVFSYMCVSLTTLGGISSSSFACLLKPGCVDGREDDEGWCELCDTGVGRCAAREHLSWSVGVMMVGGIRHLRVATFDFWRERLLLLSGPPASLSGYRWRCSSAWEVAQIIRCRCSTGEISVHHAVKSFDSTEGTHATPQKCTF